MSQGGSDLDDWASCIDDRLGDLPCQIDTLLHIGGGHIHPLLDIGGRDLCSLQSLFGLQP